MFWRRIFCSKWDTDQSQTKKNYIDGRINLYSLLLHARYNNCMIWKSYTTKTVTGCSGNKYRTPYGTPWTLPREVNRSHGKRSDPRRTSSWMSPLFLPTCQLVFYHSLFENADFVRKGAIYLSVTFEAVSISPSFFSEAPAGTYEQLQVVLNWFPNWKSVVSGFTIRNEIWEKKPVTNVYAFTLHTIAQPFA